MVSRHKGRRIAVQALYAWSVNGDPLERVVTFPWYDHDDETDLSFPHLIVAGVIAKVAEIDREIEGHLEHWQMDRVARVDLAILRMGVYCLRWQPDIPGRVTIDEAVELAKELSTDQSYRFVNGILDAVQRHIDSEKIDA